MSIRGHGSGCTKKLDTEANNLSTSGHLARTLSQSPKQGDGQAVSLCSVMKCVTRMFLYRNHYVQEHAHDQTPRLRSKSQRAKSLSTPYASEAD